MKTIQYILPVLLLIIMAACTKIKCAAPSNVPPGKYTIQRMDMPSTTAGNQQLSKQ